jgi:hypothetical protein
VLFSITNCGDDGLISEIDPGIADCTYLNARVGTVFKYKSISNIGVESFSESVVIGQSRQNGENYIVMEATIGDVTNTSYLKCSTIGLRAFTPSAESVGGVNVGDITIDYDFTQPVGEEWIFELNPYTTSGVTFYNEYRFRIVEKDITMTVAGVEYSNVYEIHSDNYSYNSINPTETKFSESRYFLAPEVMTIRTEFYLPGSPSAYYISDLIEYIY